MKNFMYHIPTKIYFGQGQISHIGEMRESGTRALLVFGGGSIKRNGIYDTVIDQLRRNGITVFELPGVEPNPRVETVRKGIELCRENSIDMVLGVGGGSSIDCAKMVAAGALYDGDVWDLVVSGSKINKALPVYAVLTIAATGSEMDYFAVISDMTKNEKWSTGAPCLRPRMAIMDPCYTASVSKKQTAAGIVDMMSHTFENYFTNVTGADFQSGVAEAILRTCINYGPIALEKPDDYNARANLMWCSSWAINGMLNMGCGVAWSVHNIEHELSAFYDVTHGEGLAVLTPVWMRKALEKAPEKARSFAEYGYQVWRISRDIPEAEAASLAINKTADFFFSTLGMPSTLRALGIKEKTHFDVMAEKASRGRDTAFVPLTANDVNGDCFLSCFQLLSIKKKNVS